MTNQSISKLSQILDLMMQPACVVADGQLVSANCAAQNLMLLPGMTLAQAVGYNPLAERDPSGSAIRFSAAIAGHAFDATLQRIEDVDVLLLQPGHDAPPAELEQLGAVSHALRAPLGDLFSAARDLFPFLESQEDPTIQHYTASITRSLYQLLRIAANLSDAPLLLGKNTPISRERLDLCEVLAALVQEAAPLCEAAGFHLSCELVPTYCYLCIDRAKVERAVLNLLSNAMQYAEAGSTIELLLTRQGKIARITVRDHGEGVDPALLATVFSRFQQPIGFGDTRSTLGLGLSFVRRIAELHGGTVMLDSQDGTGVSVTMTLNADEQLQHERQLNSPTLQYDAGGGYSKYLMELADVLPSEVFDSMNME